MKQLMALLFVFLLPLGYAQQAAPNYKDLDELASRVMGFGYDMPDVVVGKLPSAAQAGLEVPVPSGARVLGYTKGGGRLEVVLDVRDKPEAIFEFYKTRLNNPTDLGAYATKEQGGFSFFGTAMPFFDQDVRDKLYCTPKKSVNVVIFRVQSAIKDVRLRIDDYTCDEAGDSVALPQLFLPTGAQPFTGNSLTGSSMIGLLNVTLKAALSSYTGQLESNNWKQLELAQLKAGTVAIYAKNNMQIMLSLVTRTDGQVLALMQLL